MRDDQVHRLGPKTNRAEGARVIDLDGEVMWLLDDIVRLRDGNPNLNFALVDRIPEAEMEHVWVIFPDKETPVARWVVTADGAAVAHDVLASQAERRRRRTGRNVPMWKVAGNPPRGEQEEG